MEEAPEAKRVQLLDLPTEVLQMVMGHLDLYRHKLLREASQELKRISTSYILHRHRSYEATHREGPSERASDRAERIMLQILRSTISYFSDADSESDLAISLLHFHDSEAVFNSEADHLGQFLAHFLFLTEQSFNIFSAERLKLKRLHYTMAVFGLLRQFRNFRILGFGRTLLHWNVEAELTNTFIGVIDEENESMRTMDSQRRIYFVSILAELLFHEKIHQNYGGQRGYNGTLYTYSIQPDSKAKRNPRMFLKFMVEGPQFLSDFLHDLISGEDDPHQPFHLPPGTDFTIRVETRCLRGPQFVYFGNLNFNLLGWSELGD
ncbi:uncharacterized protein LOC6543667 [Drosophila erecta]|uniref:F-box domain-containing protein n=1 Tax=Drosophila erecta TaxID=7220 RepID=B3NHX6_DROER|nr:uncharacterized protein LOC6543667 [Drosophila erecta]EDV51991.1 uncharacterized protein Dere_GG13607 [Drosophila erecta]